MKEIYMVIATALLTMLGMVVLMTSGVLTHDVPIGSTTEQHSEMQSTQTSQQPAGNTQSGTTTSTNTSTAQVDRSRAVSDQSDEEYTSDVAFTLKTSIGEGRLIYVGVGGEIDGVTNPTLNIPENAFVQITIINGDGALHDFVIDEFGVKSDQILGVDASTVISFQASERGEYFYYCSIPGHRQAGMEGRIVIGEPQARGPVVDSIARSPIDLPGPIGDREPRTIRLDLETIERTAELADGTTYTFWTFNNHIPGPFIRVRVGDTVEVHMKNADNSSMIHSVDFHAVTGPGGGATLTQTAPGDEKVFTFKAMNPGLYVYHCATPMVAHHITNGMYGLILVEPEGGLPPVDREFYVMQGEMYTVEKFGQRGDLSFSVDKLLSEDPEYFVFNGAVGALTNQYPLEANVGETVRIFFGVGGPNYTSSFHLIGEIFDRVYKEASLTSPPLTNVQTTTVAPGGATMVEFKLDVPGRYILVDHALSRLELGLVGFLIAEGAANDIYYEGPVRN